jgi:hypothetical protein
MRIDYCPMCHKAGLRYENEQGQDPSGKTQQQRFEAYQNAQGKYQSAYGSLKWCKRCQAWVTPENHPFVSRRNYNK